MTKLRRDNFSTVANEKGGFFRLELALFFAAPTILARANSDSIDAGSQHKAVPSQANPVAVNANFSSNRRGLDFKITHRPGENRSDPPPESPEGVITDVFFLDSGWIVGRLWKESIGEGVSLRWSSVARQVKIPELAISQSGEVGVHYVGG